MTASNIDAFVKAERLAEGVKQTAIKAATGNQTLVDVADAAYLASVIAAGVTHGITTANQIHAQMYPHHVHP